ncbi:ADP-ribosylation factor GTPase-activating protein [Musa troglodytarum]|uniref:ADP-ribosylation factor GTPase-activating protein n=1 Tax=Musa troglodytarum TaxID=320322 RepID=A0A9E7F421_9LILI|nr:ADP-ribosylation factor GTPase-activating protein [Musa troglodytarum]
MENVLGLLRVRVLRGVNLASRDAGGSDAYVVLRMGDQKLKTSVKKNSLNPEWNEDLTLCVTDPIQPLKLEVYDKDTFTPDDIMGDAELDIRPFMDAIKMDLAGIPNVTIITTVRPSRQNCLADDSHISRKDGTVAQDVVLRLRNVESGEVELQLLWVNIPHAQDI